MGIFSFCVLAVFSMSSLVNQTDASISCEDIEAGGYFDPANNHITINEDMSYEYTQQVITHEVAHAYDFKLGVELNGFPSFISQTHSTYDVERVARTLSLYLGMWPLDESFGVMPSQHEINVLHDLELTNLEFEKYKGEL